MIDFHDIEMFFENKDLDLRKTRNGRWIDQKCTPDVLWSISDFVLNYISNIKETFSVADIWRSDYAKLTIAETYSKPDADSKAAENEYDKVFAQPLSLLCYAGVIEDISENKKIHLYKVANLELLKYIATNDSYSLKFLQIYIEKVLKDSGLYDDFEMFFNKQDSAHFYSLKDKFINFYHNYTPIKAEFEPKRIFTKVINPLAQKYVKLGSSSGRISKEPIRKIDLMYNRDNFRDIFVKKPKSTPRKEWVKKNKKTGLRNGYLQQQLNHAKATLSENNKLYRSEISELTQFDDVHFVDYTKATQIHHIFPKNEFPLIQGYIENLISLTPNQHYNYAHPNNNTSVINLEAQKVLLIAKTASIQQNLTSNNEERIYSFGNFLYVLEVGWNDNTVENIDDGDYLEVIRVINTHYLNI